VLGFGVLSEASAVLPFLLASPAAVVFFAESPAAAFAVLAPAVVVAVVVVVVVVVLVTALALPEFEILFLVLLEPVTELPAALLDFTRWAALGAAFALGAALDGVLVGFAGDELASLAAANAIELEPIKILAANNIDWAETCCLLSCIFYLPLKLATSDRAQLTAEATLPGCNMVVTADHSRRTEVVIGFV